MSDLPELWLDRGNALYLSGRSDDALIAYDRALVIKPDLENAWLGRGNILRAQQRHDEALAAYDKALTLSPGLAEAWVGRGNVLRALKRHGEAMAAYGRALAANPDFAEAWLSRGNILSELKRHDEGCAAYDKALALRPNLADAWIGRGNVYAELSRHDEAIVAYGRALSLDADLPTAWIGCGNVLAKLKLYDQALAAYDQALTRAPDLAAAWLGRANVLYFLRGYDGAIDAYAKVLTLQPDTGYVQGACCDSKLHVCAWQGYDDHRSALINDVRDGKRVVDPVVFLNLSSAPADQLRCAKLFSTDKFPAATKPNRHSGRTCHDRIRLAYISADLREHAVSFLLAGVFERHDRARFETMAFSLHSDCQSAMQTRVKSAVERFVDVSGKSDREVCRLLRELDVDIAVDLMGYTADSRPGIFASRAAPVQVNYLGYPGTLGADHIDYILADRFVIPEDQQAHYSEKVVYLPDTFQANDSMRRSSWRAPSRAEVGLPDHGFVFCSFNNAHKITPTLFSIWMRLLRNVEGSVLWLYASNAAAEHNLRREAANRGIESNRLVFAPGIEYSRHLARLQLGDLFLDTLPFNAGATASDALWAGLPIVTCSGDAFASRMAGSLLHAVGLPELVTRTLEEYEVLASNLARDPALLASLKAKLARDRDTCTLFNTEWFTRHIEAAYTSMWERNQLGQPPAGFAIKPMG